MATSVSWTISNKYAKLLKDNSKIYQSIGNMIKQELNESDHDQMLKTHIMTNKKTDRLISEIEEKL